MSNLQNFFADLIKEETRTICEQLNDCTPKETEPEILLKMRPVLILGLSLGIFGVLLMAYLFFAPNLTSIFLKVDFTPIYNNFYRFTLGDAANELVINLLIIISSALTGGIIAYVRDC